jgi:hypothetical protein
MLWSGLIAMGLSNYLNVAIFSFVQVRYPQFDTGMHIFSSIAGIIAALVCTILPFFLIYVHYRFKKRKRTLKKKYAPIVEGLKTKKFVQQCFLSLVLMQNLIYAIAICCLQAVPYVQISALLVTNVAMLFLIFNYKPYAKNALAFMNIWSNIITLPIFLIIAFLIDDDHRPFMDGPRRINIGWGIIILFCLSLLGIMISIIYDQVTTLFRAFKRYSRKKLLKKKRLAALNAGRGLQPAKIGQSPRKMTHKIDTVKNPRIQKFIPKKFMVSH